MPRYGGQLPKLGPGSSETYLLAPWDSKWGLKMCGVVECRRPRRCGPQDALRWATLPKTQSEIGGKRPGYLSPGPLRPRRSPFGPPTLSACLFRYFVVSVVFVVLILVFSKSFEILDMFFGVTHDYLKQLQGGIHLLMFLMILGQQIQGSFAYNFTLNC